jgi:predicted dehydrogenase
MSRARTIIFGPAHWHFPLYADRISALHEVVGMSEGSPTPRVRHQAQLWGVPLYSSWKELLARHGDAELAYVLVPHDEMSEVCLALVGQRIPLVVEKPAGISLQQVTEIREAAEAAGLPIAVPLVLRLGPVDRWLAMAGSSVYESVQFIVGPPDRYSTNGSPWMLDPNRAGGGCLLNLAPHFVDLFLRSTGAQDATATLALSSALHHREIEDYASLTVTTPDGRVATIDVGYAFPSSPSKRHCAYLRIGTAGAATVQSDGRAFFTSTDGATQSALLDVDTDPLYGAFVDQVAKQLDRGFAGLPGIRDLEAAMKVIWDAYSTYGERETGVTTKPEQQCCEPPDGHLSQRRTRRTSCRRANPTERSRNGGATPSAPPRT